MTQQRSGSQDYSAADRLMALVAKALDQTDTAYVMIGGQAVVQHGYSRVTLVVDISLAVSTDGIRTISTKSTASASTHASRRMTKR